MLYRVRFVEILACPVQIRSYIPPKMKGRQKEKYPYFLNRQNSLIMLSPMSTFTMARKRGKSNILFIAVPKDYRADTHYAPASAGPVHKAKCLQTMEGLHKTLRKQCFMKPWNLLAVSISRIHGGALLKTPIRLSSGCF